MPACHLTEAERRALVNWLERQQQAFGLPPAVAAGLAALQRECPARRGLKEPECA